MKLKYISAIFATLICMTLPGRLNGQPANLQTKIEKQRFDIEVQSLTPARGGLRILNPYYNFSVSPDTVATELPYFGRLYQASMNPSDNGIRFTSQAFDYVVRKRRKGGWAIQITTRDTPRNPKINLTIMPGGTATLIITSNDRETISYNGIVRVD